MCYAYAVCAANNNMDVFVSRSIQTKSSLRPPPPSALLSTDKKRSNGGRVLGPKHIHDTGKWWHIEQKHNLLDAIDMFVMVAITDTRDTPYRHAPRPKHSPLLRQKQFHSNQSEWKENCFELVAINAEPIWLNGKGVEIYSHALLIVSWLLMLPFSRSNLYDKQTNQCVCVLL